MTDFSDFLTTKHRYLRPAMELDLQEKMVFLGGPRQVGKTSLARSLLDATECEMNYDIAGQREKILRHQLPDTKVWFFDEIHKYRNWRNFLKGLYDQNQQWRAQGLAPKKILVTGSAKLDVYRHGGDSLQGRYFHMRLHPLSVAELGGSADALPALLNLGGFPEPFFKSSEAFMRRWQTAYRDRLIREEVVSLETVSDLAKLELLSLALPERVGSPLSLNSLREDLMVQHATLARWCEILERLYAIFRIPPFGSPLLRAVKKEQKHYHYDWMLVQNPGARFENLVACHLLKWTEYQLDTQGHRVELRYFRDTAGREVDFCITHNATPSQPNAVAFVECKWADGEISQSLKYIKARFPQAQCWQITCTGVQDYLSKEGIRVAPASVLLSQLV